MDVGNGVLQFERTILSASVRPVNPEHTSSTDQYDVFVFEVKGLAFLYHQVSENLTVRTCMISVELIYVASSENHKQSPGFNLFNELYSS